MIIAGMRENYSAWDVNQEDFFKVSPGRECLEFLIRFAVLAPSSHNAQPWKFEVGSDFIRVLPDMSRALPVSDPENRHLFVSLGCALENILIAADYYGLKASVRYPQEGSADAAATISFKSPVSGVEPADTKHLIFAIPERRSNRNRYTGPAPDGSFLGMIKRTAPDGIEVTVITDPEKKDAIADIFLGSRILAFDDQRFRSEMADYKRNNLTRSPLGITGITMGFNTPLSFLAPFVIRHMNVMKLIRKSEEDLLKRYTPVFILINSMGNGPEDWLRTGQAMEHLALEAERCRLHTAISAIPRDVLPLKKILATEYRPQIFLRLGRAEGIPPHSPRMSFGKVIVPPGMIHDA